MNIYSHRRYDRALTESEIQNNYNYELIARNPNTSNIIETNITSKINIPTYEGLTCIFIKNENKVNPILKATIDRLPNIANNAVEESVSNSISSNIALARMYVNMLPESSYKDQLQEQLNQLFSEDIVLERQTATTNLDVYIKSENMLKVSLDTNIITFEDYSGVEPIEKLSAINLTINSSLPYQLNAYLPNKIQSDNGNEIDLDVLNIREGNESEYKTFDNTTDKIVLKENCASGNNTKHSIDLKLDSTYAHKADIYKTVIKFEAEQK